MSDTSSLAENSYEELSDNTDEDYAVEVEDFDPQNAVAEAIPLDQRGIIVPYADEPIADAAWLAGYRQRREAERKRLEEFEKRLVGTTELEIWCKCGNCNTETLQNPLECYCCTEIEACVNSLSSDRVLADCGTAPICVTDHPGFRPICLETWPLLSAAPKYKTKQGGRYRQTGSEEKFLRGVAYREFTRLVHGFLGKKRIPLPACCYHAIRLKFREPAGELTGYQADI